MDWFKSKGGQVIALVTIIGTLAGFGYTGAMYVNRIENLEKKVVGIITTKLGLQEIEKRFETLETSLEYINKSLDSENTGLISKIDTNDESISLVKSQLEGLSVAVRALEKDVEKLEDGDKNPLAN